MIEKLRVGVAAAVGFWLTVSAGALGVFVGAVYGGVCMAGNVAIT